MFCFYNWPGTQPKPISLRLKRVFPRSAAVSCFPALDSGYMFSGTWHRLHVFPRLAAVTCFPALGSGYMFPRPWYWLHVFPRSAAVTCFPALDSGYIFFRVWHQWHVFSRLAQVTGAFPYVRFNYFFLFFTCKPNSIFHFLWFPPRGHSQEDIHYNN